jgi:hypothetical protein
MGGGFSGLEGIPLWPNLVGGSLDQEKLLEARYVRRFRAFVALILALVTVLSEFHLSREGKTVCLAYSSK